MRKLTAVVTFLFALLWLELGRPFVGMLWLVISLGWAVATMIGSEDDPVSASRLARRFSRLFLFFS
jgi:hypothetical protein